MTRPAIILVLLALSACSQRAPDDAQLVTLLHAGGLTSATGTSRPLDAIAVQCLSAHAGDASLTRDLPPAALTDAAKSQCRRRLDLWLADTSRNPDKFTFAEVATPPVAARALQLYLANGGIPLAQAPAAAPPASTPAPGTEAPAASPAANAAPPAEAAEPEPPMPDTISALAEADNICRDVQAATAQGPFNARLSRYAEGCAAMLRSTRDQVAQLQQQGRNDEADTLVHKLVHSYRQAQRLLRQGGG